MDKMTTKPNPTDLTTQPEQFTEEDLAQLLLLPEQTAQERYWERIAALLREFTEVNHETT